MFGFFCRRSVFYLQHQIWEHLKKSQTLSAVEGSSSWRPGGDARLSIGAVLLFECGYAPLRQRCRLGRRIVFRHLVVDFLGLVRLLPRLVEAGEFELGGGFANDECR